MGSTVPHQIIKLLPIFKIFNRDDDDNNNNFITIS